MGFDQVTWMLVLCVALLGCGATAASTSGPAGPEHHGGDDRLLVLDAEQEGDRLRLPEAWVRERSALRDAFAPFARELGEAWQVRAAAPPSTGPLSPFGAKEGSSSAREDMLVHTWRARWSPEDAAGTDPRAVLSREGFEERAGADAFGLGGGLGGESDGEGRESAWAHPDGTTASLRESGPDTELSVTVVRALDRERAGALLGALGRRVEAFAALGTVIDDVGAAWARLEVSRSAAYAPFQLLAAPEVPPAVGERVERSVAALPVEPVEWPYENVTGRLFRTTSAEVAAYLELSVDAPTSSVRLLNEPPS